MTGLISLSKIYLWWELDFLPRAHLQLPLCQLKILFPQDKRSFMITWPLSLQRKFTSTKRQRRGFGGSNSGWCLSWCYSCILRSVLPASMLAWEALKGPLATPESRNEVTFFSNISNESLNGGRIVQQQDKVRGGTFKSVASQYIGGIKNLSSQKRYLCF